MRPRYSMTIIAIVISLLLAGPALAWDEARLKSQVQELLDQAAAGFAKKDAQAISATSVPQATIKYRDGRSMGMDQWREVVAKELADWQDVRSRFVVEKVWPKGKDQAGALYTERHEFGRTSDPGHQYVISARFRALLIKTPQGWRFQEFSDLGTRLTRDDRPLGPKAK